MNLTLNRACVQQARERRGWTQRHLADFADLSLRTVERAESRGTASLDTVKRLGRALDITLDELLNLIFVQSRDHVFSGLAGRTR